METGNYYYGARYYDPKVSVWLSVDPMADQRPSLTPYNFVSNNPVMRIDPTGMLDWQPGVDENGNATYTAEAGDNANTLASQYGLTQEQAEQITGTKGSTPIAEGTQIDGCKAYEATGSEVLKLDWQSSQATDSRRIDHTLFAMEYENTRSFEFETKDYFQNMPYNHPGETYGYGGAAFLKGYTNKITGNPLYVQMMLNYKTKHPIATTPTSNDNWFVPHQGYYYFRYNAQSGAARPTVPMFIKFKGESNMRAFTKKFGFEFSGITR